MNKVLKGAIAAAAAGVLLLGGLGTMSYWTDTGTVDGGTLTSGSIALGTVECGGWKHTSDDSDVTMIVPGDNVYNDCVTTLTLVGDNIGATLEIDETSIPTTPLGDVLTHEVGLLNSEGVVITGVTEAGSTVVTAHLEVGFPYGGPVSEPDPTTGDDNTTQSGTAVLDALTLVAVQTNTTA